MNRTRLAAPVAGALATGLIWALAGQASAGPAHQGCPPYAAHVVGRGGLVRVYTTAAGPPGAGTVEACLMGRTGHMTLLRARAGAHLGRSLQYAASSGPLVAYEVTTFGVDSGSTSLLIADVQARRVLRELPVGNYVDAGILEREAPTKVVLGPEGAVAWIAAGHGPNQQVTYTVRAAATIGPVEILDEANDVGATSLTLKGRTLGWWHGGQERHAQLP